MGIITEELNPKRALLQDTEFVRPPVDFKLPQKISLESDSLSLNDNCLVFRNEENREITVTIVPTRNVEFLRIRTRRHFELFMIGALLLSVLAGLSIYYWPGGTFQLGIYQSPSQVFHQFYLFWAALPFVISMVIILMIYAFRRRVELVIWTRSGRHPFRIFLQRAKKESLEQLVANIQSQLQNNCFREKTESSS